MDTVLNRLADIERATGFTGVELRIVDLASFESVNVLGEGFEKEELKLDILVYNAGVNMIRYETTGDGWETT